MRLLVAIFPFGLVFGTANATASENAPRIDEFIVDKTSFDRWQITARTKLRWMRVNPPDSEKKPVPFYHFSECIAVSPHFEFSMNDMMGLNWLQINLRNSDGVEPAQTWSFDIDGDKIIFGYMNKNPAILENYAYSDIVESERGNGFLGYQAFKKTKDGDWIRSTRMFQRLLDADQITATVLPIPEGEEVDERLRLTPGTAINLDIGGLKQAVSWCSKTLRSKAAYSFPANQNEQKAKSQ